MRKFTQSYKNNDDGVAAIELAFVILPLTYLIIGIIEIALMFTSSIVLEGATSDAARLVRVGQVQQAASASDGQDLFEQALCNTMSILADCADIEYEVITLDAGFGGAAGNTANFDNEGAFQSQGFNAGGVSDVVLIRAVYKYPLKTPIISQFFQDNSDGTRLMISTVVLQTEPYDFED
tara:strand:+ start:121104 stop:121640 length:537 start_codon:yes stop_codon:yes gene_type:complete